MSIRHLNYFNLTAQDKINNTRVETVMKVLIIIKLAEYNSDYKYYRNTKANEKIQSTHNYEIPTATSCLVVMSCSLCLLMYIIRRITDNTVFLRIHLILEPLKKKHIVLCIHV